MRGAQLKAQGQLYLYSHIDLIRNGTIMNGGLRRVKKVKVKLSLCLAKHHAMEMYWRVEVELHAFFDLGTRWR
jgi:hypothetical protein